MKITSFNPIIVTKDAKAVTALFEELGFEIRHTKGGFNAENVRIYDMKNADGFRVDVSEKDGLEQARLVIRMNVDDINEACKLLTAHGFKNARGDEIEDSGSSKTALMVSPSGYCIRVIQHTK